MKNFNNPLDDIKIASPCSADWSEMISDERRRHCAACQLNVYNLSDMTRGEAENFLINSEGRVCVKFYRRRDGTVLTKDCPVGWEKLKRKVSRTATAIFSMFAGIFGGLFAFNQFSIAKITLSKETVPDSNKSVNHVFVVEIQKKGNAISPPENWRDIRGGISLDDLHIMKSKINKSRKR